MESKMYIAPAVRLDDLEVQAANWLGERYVAGREVTRLQEQLAPGTALLLFGGRRSIGVHLCPNNATARLTGAGGATEFHAYCRVVRTTPTALKGGVMAITAPVVYFGAALSFGLGRLAGHSTGEGKPTYRTMLDRAGQSATRMPDVPGKVVEQSKRIQCIQMIAIDPQHPPDVRAELVLPIGQGITGIRLFTEFERMGWVKD